MRKEKRRSCRNCLLYTSIVFNIIHMQHRIQEPVHTRRIESQRLCNILHARPVLPRQIINDFCLLYTSASWLVCDSSVMSAMTCAITSLLRSVKVLACICVPSSVPAIHS